MSGRFAIWALTGLLLAIVGVLQGCPEHPPEQPPEEKTERVVPSPPAEADRDIIERVVADLLPEFRDDSTLTPLATAVRESLEYYRRVPDGRAFAFGGMAADVVRMRETLELFLELLEAGRLNRETLAAHFDVYRVTGGDRGRPLLVTGYYEPVLEGRLEPDQRFRYPLYGVPPNLVKVELALFDAARFGDTQLTGRVDGNRVIPYFSRAEIDGDDTLADCGCQLAWLDDPIEAFFLHVQGSGVIRLVDGSFRRLGYAGKNGRTYRSIGKYMIERGYVPSEGMSLQAVSGYLRSHPEVRDEVLYQNDSYVFFRWVEKGPLGSIGRVLTPGRSVALDPAVYPRGGLAYLVSEQPEVDGAGRVTGWRPVQRWVLNQDAGGAIKGTGRLDLFFGSGQRAEWLAGRMKQPGELYLILKKRDSGY